MAIKSNLASFEPARIKYAQTIQLISHGYFAPNAFPGGMITVYPWDSDTDAWITTRSKQGPGLIWDLAAQLCDLKGVSIDEFPVGDVNTILLVSRAIKHDNQVFLREPCPLPICQHPNEGIVRVPDELEKLGEKDANYPGYDIITLPECQDVVKIRPLLVKDDKAIEGRDEKAKRRLPDRTAKVLAPIVSINDTQPDTIDELNRWYHALPPKDRAELEQKEEELYPHLNTQIDWKCNKCGTEFSFPLTFDTKFFRAASPPKS